METYKVEGYFTYPAPKHDGIKESWEVRPFDHIVEAKSTREAANRVHAMYSIRVDRAELIDTGQPKWKVSYTVRKCVFWQDKVVFIHDTQEIFAECEADAAKEIVDQHAPFEVGIISVEKVEGQDE